MKNKIIDFYKGIAMLAVLWLHIDKVNIPILGGGKYLFFREIWSPTVFYNINNFIYKII